MGFMSNPATGGEFDPYLKYNAKAGRWYTKKDEPNAAEYEVANMTAIFDIPGIRTGWFLFTAGAAPEKKFDTSLSEASARPGENFKRGFELKVYSDKNFGGVREFTSTAGAVIDAMNDLYDAYTAAPEAKAGKLPVVKCVRVDAVTGKHGTNYKPTLEIVQWADRPAELTSSAPATAPAPTATPAQPASPAAQPAYTPPTAAPQPAMAGGDDVEF